MTFVAILALAQEGIGLIAQGRGTIDRVKDAISDSKEALSSTEKAQLEQLLSQEAEESKAAHDSLNAAIDAALR